MKKETSTSCKRAFWSGFLDGFTAPATFLFGDYPSKPTRASIPFLPPLKRGESVERAWKNTGRFLQGAMVKVSSDRK